MFSLELYQHKKDKQLFGSLVQMKIANELFDWCEENQLDRAYQYAYQASCLKITPSSVPEVYDLLEKACVEFELKKIPALYLSRNYDIKAEIIGIIEPGLIISEDYLNIISKESLYGVISSMIAGIKAGHHRGLGLSWMIETCVGALPVPHVAVVPVKALLNDWKRCRWYTCDRAFLLATGDYQLTLKSLFDRAVPMHILDRFRLGAVEDAYLNQLQRFQEASSAEEIANVLHSAQSDETWLPLRYQELQAFYSVNAEVIGYGKVGLSSS